MTDAEWMLAVMEWQDREAAAFAEQWERFVIEMAAAIVEMAEEKEPSQ